MRTKNVKQKDANIKIFKYNMWFRVFNGDEIGGLKRRKILTSLYILAPHYFTILTGNLLCNTIIQHKIPIANVSLNYVINCVLLGNNK
jgi:hypothetical protein